MIGDGVVRGAADGSWGPTLRGGRSLYARRLAFAAAGVLGVVLVAVVTIVTLLYRVADRNIERIDVPALARVEGGHQPLNVLVVGSDSREGLSPAEIERLHLGEFGGQRGDTVMLVSITADRDQASVVSFPRDLAVDDGGQLRKLTETFADGPDHVVQVLQGETGVPIHHYVEVSIPGFMSVVEAVGGVHLCLDRPLRDWRSGADFDAGCHDMSSVQALAYVRSRATELGDFDRIARQQEFMRALLDRVVATRTLVDVPRLFNVVEQVSRHVTTDSGLSVNQMRSLAMELRELAEGSVPMTVVPSYTRTLDGKSFVVPYDPGAEAIYHSLRDGQPIVPRGTAEERHATAVTVWAAGQPDAAERIRETLYWSSFSVVEHDPGQTPPPARTVVYAAPGREDRAGWVAATLGAEVAPPPDGLALPPDAHAVVVAGADAAPDADA